MSRENVQNTAFEPLNRHCLAGKRADTTNCLRMVSSDEGSVLTYSNWRRKDDGACHSLGKVGSVGKAHFFVICPVYLPES